MLETKPLTSGYAQTFVCIIAANVCGKLIHREDLTCLDHEAGNFYCSVSSSWEETATLAQLRQLDSLLTENNPSLRGVIFKIYNEANNFLEPVYDWKYE